MPDTTTYADGLVIRTLETPGLGDRSYVAILDGVAVAVDVQRDLDRVEALLDEHDARLGAVLETHIHNDYLTGGLVLARRHRAEYVVPAGPRLGYSATRAVDGTALHLGSLTIRAIDAPGHTDAHAAFSVHVESGIAQAAFTGGSLLLGATGRTDLLGLDRADALARQQYWSVRRMARILSPETRILPTHGFGSFCVAGSPVQSGDTVADQLAVNPAYLLSENEFVDDLLSRLGDYPAYYAFMGPRNAGGVWSAEVPDVPAIDLVTLLGTDATREVVLDVRSRGQWAEAHVPGSISVDARGALATWVGWVTPIDAPVTLVAESAAQADQAVRELHRIGVDGIAGVHVTPSLSGVGEVAATERASFGDLAREFATGPGPIVIDAREASEWRRGHVAGAIHVSAHDVVEAFRDALPPEAPWIYCGVGMRATVAASQLERLGGSAVIIDDDVATARGAGVPWCDGATCSDHLCTRELAVVPA